MLCGACHCGFLKVQGPDILCEVSRGRKIGEPQSTIVVYWGYIAKKEWKLLIMLRNCVLVQEPTRRGRSFAGSQDY